MKRLLLILIGALAIAVGYGQTPTIAVDGGVVEVTTDLDAKTYFPKYDINDRLCALLKVSVTNELKNPLILEVGGLGVVARQERESGEIWFYLPAQVKNLHFLCKGYAPIDPIAVQFKEGVVYRLTLNPLASATVVFDAMLSTNYFKLEVSEPNTVISIGRTQEYELFTKNIDERNFAELLDYGTYFYKVEHELFETYFGSVVIDNATTKQEITLIPAYGYLDIDSTPSGAVAYVNNRRIGTTPCRVEERLPRGDVELRLVMEDYYTSTSKVRIAGDGSRQTVTQPLKPRFANITITCPDSEAEIWVDNEPKGRGGWSGRLGSMTKHFVESRREGHKSQSLNISVQDGVDATHTIAAPVPLYGTLNITTTPLDCTIAIDGRVVGESPYIGKMLVGDYEISLSKDGYHQLVFPITVKYNENLSVNKELVVDDSFSTARDLIKELINNQIDEQSESQNKIIVEDIEVGEEEILEEPVFVKVEQMPSFMGGDLSTFRNWFVYEFKIPAEMAEKGIQGKVVVKFVVEKDGSIGGIEFLQSPDKVYEDEVRRVLMKSPRWTPGKQREQSVRVFYILPIDCRLQ